MLLSLYPWAARAWLHQLRAVRLQRRLLNLLGRYKPPPVLWCSCSEDAKRLCANPTLVGESRIQVGCRQ